MTTQTQYAWNTQANVTLVAFWCPECGIPYGLPQGFLKQRREDNKTWTCPNGCKRWYPPGSSDLEKKAERLESELEAARSLAQREAQRRTRAEGQARLKEYQRRAAVGQLTKTKKRIAAGVCPCCNRTFQNVARHIAGQHPDYVDLATETETS